MPLRIILFSDLHYKEETAEICINVLRSISKEAVRREIPLIGFLGDWFHIRNVVPVRLLNALKDELLEWAKLKLRLFIIPGNHDQVDVSGRNALEVFDEFDGVHVFTAPNVNELGLWIPYRADQKQVIDALKLWKPGTPKVVFAHAAIKGALMNHLVANEDGLDPSVFNGFQKVLLGHYHKRQAVGPGDRCQYIGSPYQTRADEAGQEKGFAIWDGNCLEYVTREWGPKFHRIHLPEGAPVNLQNAKPTDRIRVVVETEAEVERVGRELKTLGVHDAVVEPKKIGNTTPRLAVPAGSNFYEYARAFVDAEHGELDPKALMSVFEELTT